ERNRALARGGTNLQVHDALTKLRAEEVGERDELAELAGDDVDRLGGVLLPNAGGDSGGASLTALAGGGPRGNGQPVQYGHDAHRGLRLERSGLIEALKREVPVRVERVEDREIEEVVFLDSGVTNVVAREVALEVGAHRAGQLGEGGPVDDQATRLGRHAIGV